MLKKLRLRLQEIKDQKRQTFDELQSLIKKIAVAYAPLFPNFTENTNGSHYVYNFGIPSFNPFTIIKEHGGRDCQNPRTAKRAIAEIGDILDYIEMKIPDDQATLSEGDHGNERTEDKGEETSGTVSEPEIPNGDH